MKQIITSEMIELRYSHNILKENIIESDEVYVGEIILYQSTIVKEQCKYYEAFYDTIGFYFVGKITAIYENNIIIEHLGNILNSKIKEIK